MAPRIVPENLRGTINTLMRQNQLSVEDVRRRLRGRTEAVPVHGVGRFDCECENGWSSAYSWISVDLADQTISRRWKMKCKNWGGPRRCGVVEPTFTLEEMERMVAEAIRLFKGERRDFYRRAGPRRERPAPHLRELCEKCKWGQDTCWRAAPYRPPPPPSNPPSVNGDASDVGDTTSQSELGDTDHTSTDSE